MAVSCCSSALREQALPLDSFIENLETYPPTRVRAAVFLNSATLGVPHALLHNLKHNKVLHERIVLMTVQNIDEPYVKTENRVKSSACQQLLAGGGALQF